VLTRSNTCEAVYKNHSYKNKNVAHGRDKKPTPIQNQLSRREEEKKTAVFIFCTSREIYHADEYLMLLI
jgi:hypothetical protein